MKNVYRILAIFTILAASYYLIQKDSQQSINCSLLTLICINRFWIEELEEKLERKQQNESI